MFYDDEPMGDGGGTAMPPAGDEEDGEKDGEAGGEEMGGGAAM